MTGKDRYQAIVGVFGSVTVFVNGTFSSYEFSDGCLTLPTETIVRLARY